MNRLQLAFCPTMTPYAEVFNREIDEITLVQVPSAAQVMSMLRNGSIDIALIGRDASNRELIPEIAKKRLQGGVTLVYFQKSGIPKEQLLEIPIKTYISKERAEKVLPSLENVKFYSSLTECEQNDVGMPMLIDWEDYKDEYELLIPMENNGAKVPEFRAPVIFYNFAKVSDDVVKKFESAMTKIKQ
jgi:hypothetical protein